MKYLRKLICAIVGHKDIAIVCANNERSTWGWFHCSRCGRDEAFQYDYD